MGSDLSGDGFWTFDAVKERLTEAMRLWWRSPGEGRWPFAADAPWHLITRSTRIYCAGYKPGRERDLHMQAEDAEETKRREGREWGPLTRDDVARRDETSEWLGWIDADARKVVIAALVQLAAGRTNISWARVKASLGSEVTRQGVYKRYATSITAIVRRLNGESS